MAAPGPTRAAAPDPPRCPVCRASYRGEAACSRCGADLEPIMLLSAKAYVLREKAREALLAGNVRGARALVDRAEELCETEAGRRFRLLCSWLEIRAHPGRGR